MGQFFVPGYPPQNPFQPMFPPVQPYPGDNFINSSPAYQFNPSFDGKYYHGTQVNPYMNYLFEDVNALQGSIYGSYGPGFGYPPIQQGWAY